MDAITQLAFQIISLAGEGRSLAFESLDDAKNNDFDAAKNKIEQAELKLDEAHKIQFQLLSDEAKGDNHQMNLIMVHAQDHLMTALLAIDLIKENIEMRELIKQIQ